MIRYKEKNKLGKKDGGYKTKEGREQAMAVWGKTFWAEEIARTKPKGKKMLIIFKEEQIGQCS